MTRFKLLLAALVLSLFAFSIAEEETANETEDIEEEEEQVDFFAQTRHLLLKPS